MDNYNIIRNKQDCLNIIKKMLIKDDILEFKILDDKTNLKNECLIYPEEGKFIYYYKAKIEKLTKSQIIKKLYLVRKHFNLTINLHKNESR